MDILDLERKSFDLEDGRKFLFVKFVPPRSLLVWERNERSNGEEMNENKSQVCKGIDVQDVDVEVLKSLEVWDKLTVEMQRTIGTREIRAVEDVNDLMQKARASRRKKYPNMPKEIQCSTCSNLVEVVAGNVVAKMNKKGITLDEFISTFKCKKCKLASKPARTAKAKLICKCGFEVIYPMSVIQKTLDKKGLSMEEYIKVYQCRKCTPKVPKVIKEKVVKEKVVKLGVMNRRGRVPNPDFAKYGKMMKCSKCGKEVTLNPTYLQGKAKKLGTTMDDLIRDFKCQECCPTKGRQKKVV